VLATERTRKPSAQNRLGLLAPPSDVELQEKCIQMEKIEMQHRIHQGETASVAKDQSIRRHHLKLTIGNDLRGGMFLATRRRGVGIILTNRRCRLYNMNFGDSCLNSGGGCR